MHGPGSGVSYNRSWPVLICQQWTRPSDSTTSPHLFHVIAQAGWYHPLASRRYFHSSDTLAKLWYGLVVVIRIVDSWYSISFRVRPRVMLSLSIMGFIVINIPRKAKSSEVEGAVRSRAVAQMTLLALASATKVTRGHTAKRESAQSPNAERLSWEMVLRALAFSSLSTAFDG